jgi:HSP20 family protein
VFGSFSRSFAFPVPVKSEGVQAKLENGVLKVVVPKIEPEREQGRRIEIEEVGSGSRVET